MAGVTMTMHGVLRLAVDRHLTHRVFHDRVALHGRRHVRAESVEEILVPLFRPHVEATFAFLHNRQFDHRDGGG